VILPELPQVSAAKLAAALVALLAILAGGLYLQHHERQIGAAACRAEVAEARSAATSAAAAQVLANSLRGSGASAGFQVDASALTARQPEIRHDVHQALRAPLACPPGAPQALGDVRVPAGAVDGLRRAGAAAGPDPAASR
jgi:uncharacterized membrane protein